MTCGEAKFGPYDTLLNPILIAEVLSPSTQDYDRGGKFASYRSIPSLQEYWTVAQDSILVERWTIVDAHWTLTEYSCPEDLIETPRFSRPKSVIRTTSIAYGVALQVLRYIEVMATAPQFLTVEEFDKLYGSESGWEYWYGKAVRKPVPDKLHALLQRILMQLLSAAGYESGGEFDFKARRDWQPRPDVAILPEGDERYPTKLSLVIEIRSEDQTKELIEKCRNYEQTGVSHIFVFDPAACVIYRWEKDLVEKQDLELPNGSLIAGTTIWRELQAAKTRLKMTL